MNGQENNHSFNPSDSHGLRQLGHQFGQNVISVSIGHAFFFNNPGQYNISWNSDVSSGHPQTNLGQLTRNVPTASGSITPTTSAQNFGLFGAGSAATLTQTKANSIPTIANDNGNLGNETTLSSIKQPDFAAVSPSVHPTNSQVHINDEVDVR